MLLDKAYLKHKNEFTETNPDKGTETFEYQYSFHIISPCLQKLTPIRGRKLIPGYVIGEENKQFTETNPDKGTETIFSS